MKPSITNNKLCVTKWLYKDSLEPCLTVDLGHRSCKIQWISNNTTNSLKTQDLQDGDRIQWDQTVICPRLQVLLMVSLPNFLDRKDLKALVLEENNPS